MRTAVNTEYLGFDLITKKISIMYCPMLATSTIYCLRAIQRPNVQFFEMTYKIIIYKHKYKVKVDRSLVKKS